MVPRQQARREDSEDNLPHLEEVDCLLLTEGHLALLEEVVVYRLSHQHNTASPATRVWDTSEDNLPLSEEEDNHLPPTHRSEDTHPHSQAVEVPRHLLVVAAATSEDNLPHLEAEHLSLTHLSEDNLPHSQAVEVARRLLVAAAVTSEDNLPL